MTQSKTIRLVMPQWQGGDNPLYHLGAELLDYLAPSTKTPSFAVPVTKPGMPLKNENGIMGRKRNRQTTRKCIWHHQQRKA
ncbi:hypothetical protein [uncultured Bartonella sp.]|uniref:hypothetical protein n=1 Tax=uncultured Bartonella sp. TaxID=104108 RepID=UPI0025D4CD65|nr:hypothetical protein [uncultured Bartonella sp.]